MEYPFFCKLIRWELTSLNILFLLLKHGKYLHSLIIFFWKVLYLAAYKLIFPLTTGCIFLLLCISGNFLTLDNVNFVFWGSGLFISVNSCEHCSGMQFSVEILESFSHGIGFLCVCQLLVVCSSAFEYCYTFLCGCSLRYFIWFFSFPRYASK